MYTGTLFIRNPLDENFSSFEWKVAVSMSEGIDKYTETCAMELVDELVEGEKCLVGKFFLVREAVKGFCPDLQNKIIGNYNEIFLDLLNKVNVIVKHFRGSIHCEENDVCKKFAVNLGYQLNLHVKETVANGGSRDLKLIALGLGNQRVVNDCLRIMEEIFSRSDMTIESKSEIFLSLGKIMNGYLEETHMTEDDEGNFNSRSNKLIDALEDKFVYEFVDSFESKMNEFSCGELEIDGFRDFFNKTMKAVFTVDPRRIYGIMRTFSDNANANQLVYEAYKSLTRHVILSDVKFLNTCFSNPSYVKSNVFKWLGKFNALMESDRELLVNGLNKLKYCNDLAGSLQSNLPNKSHESSNNRIESQSIMRDIENVRDYVFGKKAIVVNEVLEALLSKDVIRLVKEFLLSI